MKREDPIPPGRELDAKVAEAAGWKKYMFGRTSTRGGEKLAWLDDPKNRRGPRGFTIIEAQSDTPLYDDGDRYIPAFSTNIADAMTLLEGYDYEISHVAVHREFTVSITADAPGDPDIIERGESLPHAICLAYVASRHVCHE